MESGEANVKRVTQEQQAKGPNTFSMNSSNPEYSAEGKAYLARLERLGFGNVTTTKLTPDDLKRLGYL